jgi:hypothetical protein
MDLDPSSTGCFSRSDRHKPKFSSRPRVVGSWPVLDLEAGAR